MGYIQDLHYADYLIKDPKEQYRAVEYARKEQHISEAEFLCKIDRIDKAIYDCKRFERAIFDNKN